MSHLILTAMELTLSKGKPRMRSGVGFIPRKNTGYFLKKFRIVE